MKRIQLAGLSLLSGVLLFAAWPVSPLTLLIFIAWVPVLWIADAVVKPNVFFGYTYLSILIWNTGTTWWMWNSTDIGTIAAITAISFLMSLPWWGYHQLRKRYGKRVGYVSLVAFSMCFEYINLNCQLSWPWLTLGNVFASHPDWVQWYEYTGVSGGTLIVLVANLVFYELLISYRTKLAGTKLVTLCGVLILLPILSFIAFTYHYSRPVETSPVHQVVIVQPNIDPYIKFDAANIPVDINRLIRLSEQAADSATRLIIWPETAMSSKDWQDKVSVNPFYRDIFQMMARYPTTCLVSGIETMKFYGKNKLTSTANKTVQDDYYDDFNTSVMIHAADPLQFYNKSKLVPGVESTPAFLSFMSPVFEKFGGTAGGYGRSDESAVFTLPGSSFTVAPIICYESIYGEYVSSYVQKGATLLTIMTNDGWWGNTPGHKQHLQYARLRAIETRRWVARSANTGISAVIDADGKILETKPWDTAAVIKYNIPVLTGITFYVRYGDYLYRIATALAVLLLLWHSIQLIKKRFFSRAS